MSGKQSHSEKRPAVTKDGRHLPTNGGRKAGIPNKATGKAREAIAVFADGLAPELAQWLRASAVGVGVPYVLYHPEKDSEGKLLLPNDARFRLVGKSALWFIPLRKNGKVVNVTLTDVMAGTTPDCAWIDWLIKPDPSGAVDTFARVAEYHLPKLNRTELTDPDGNAIKPVAFIVHGEAPGSE